MESEATTANTVEERLDALEARVNLMGTIAGGQKVVSRVSDRQLLTLLFVLFVALIGMHRLGFDSDVVNVTAFVAGVFTIYLQRVISRRQKPL